MLMKKRKLRAIFFDVDDTLYSSSEFVAMARLNSIKAMIGAGLKMEVRDCLAILNRIMKKRPSNYKFLFNDFLKEAGQGSYDGVNESILIAAGVVAYHQTKNNWLKPYADVMEVLRILSQTTPLCLGVISSGLSVKQAEKIYRFGLSKFLNPNAMFFSEDLGVDKPSRQFFTIPCKRLAIHPKEAMYVGDRPVNDVKPVKALGMISVLNRRSGKYMEVNAKIRPDYIIHDFWELLEYIHNRFELLPLKKE
jgi:putative hydrolase of the HAD superfamily